MLRVKVWEETLVIPTYEVGKPEKNPIFLEKRVYQGSSGEVYPHPVIEKIYDEKIDKEYKALFLENTYIKIMILPEIGGRVQMAYDKIRERHFVYYNSVIKPALVGLTGPWISGGIEFNWPQHHRPSTFDPIDYTIEEHKDGSATVWVGEIEKMFRTKGLAGFKLYPDKAYLEINAKLFNRTPFAQTFLWWANPAVKVNDDYQSVFPPDVNAVFDHGKRDVSEFPIAKGTYYKIDYAPGTDISRYKNIPVPTSYMAITSKYDFMGGYEHDTQAGLLHVANHHVSPGKKQWTWGCGEFGQSWDRQLTDTDGPYIELMTGVFTDNQPDFSFIHPNEERTFTQYFMPYAALGIVKNATKEAMVNLEIEGQTVHLKFYTTAEYKEAKIRLSQNEIVLHESIINIDPANPYVTTIELSKDYISTDITTALATREGHILVSYTPEHTNEREIPEAAKPAKTPEEIDSVEQLFLTGWHIEQYRHATFSPLDYYKEALKRDPKDSRSNNAMGLWFLKRGKFDEAKFYFTEAINTLLARNPNPYDGESLYNLGICERMLGNLDLAYNCFYKAIWNSAWQDTSYLEIARIDLIHSDYLKALAHIEKSLSRNINSGVARHLKIVSLRLLGKKNLAIAFAKETLIQDPLMVSVVFELYLLTQNELYLQTFITKTRSNPDTYIEYAIDYMYMGCYKDAIKVLNILEFKEVENPLIVYYLGYLYCKSSDLENGLKYYAKASQLKADYCFPNRIEDVNVLSHVIDLCPNDSKAHYYLGTYFYAKRQYEDALKYWEKSVEINHQFATVHRNVALAYFNKKRDKKAALRSLEKAFELDKSDHRIFMELDQLYKILNKDLVFRQDLMELHYKLVEERDDLYLEYVTLYNLLGLYDKAYELLTSRRFHPWEGGEGKVVSQYVGCLVEKAKASLLERNIEAAIDLLEKAQVYPHNLGEGKLHGAQENDIFFWLGRCYHILKEEEKAKQYYHKASIGQQDPVIAFYYNDPQPDKMVYQGLALQEIGNNEQADEIFKKLVSFGQNHLKSELKIDYFAVSMPDLQVFEKDLQEVNEIHCHYMIGLGYMGLRDHKLAKEHLEKVLMLDNSHFGATSHLKLIEKELL